MENNRKKRAKQSFPKGNTVILATVVSNLIILFGRIPFLRMFGDIMQQFMRCLRLL